VLVEIVMVGIGDAAAAESVPKEEAGELHDYFLAY